MWNVCACMLHIMSGSQLSSTQQQQIQRCLANINEHKIEIKKAFEEMDKLGKQLLYVRMCLCVWLLSGLYQRCSMGCCWYQQCSMGCCWYQRCSMGCCWYQQCSMGCYWYQRCSMGCCWYQWCSMGCCWYLLVDQQHSIVPYTFDHCLFRWY